MSGSESQRFRTGLVSALVAYVLWGVFPLYFLLLRPAGAFEIVAWRILFSLVFCVVLITSLRTWKPFLAIARQPKILLLMGLAGALIYVNWQTYILGTLSNQVVETSLGYFINPIVTVLLGVLVLRERLRVLQWVAIGVSALAVVVLTVGYGSVPWIALVLASSFGLYGLVKKVVGPRVDAVSGLTLETVWLTPVAIVQLIVVGQVSGLVFGSVSVWHTVLMLVSGVATAIPLLLFASATRRLPLVYVGFMQFIAPILQFAIGVFVLKEPMPPERWAGFAIVWVSLALLVVDMLRASRQSKPLDLEVEGL
ncbi:EamA family transporter RarD [Herbiconiux daphne]|uniref:EamA family transporter RarD n=1 Tax=Herbiconiux daphne TaxID=2970914 RepID=A0ABT2GXD6_9MICO|nr:EamA family transporter RarD [Herbiconiux daphne]MCS5732618.1 EamA family transporter RarD [Herbiconiux daphne]